MPRISIHALLAESDQLAPRMPPPKPPFLSTLSLRRATPMRQCKGNPQWYFYPRSPCGERPRNGERRPNSREISIHALLAESDLRALAMGSKFDISIHALLAESDQAGSAASTHKR